MSSPFLTIFTRHMASRPQMFARTLASVDAQTDQDFEHIVTVDDRGRGFAWANRQFAEHQADCHGDYMFQLDDDDELATPEAAALLHAAAQRTQADIIVFRADHRELGILPDDEIWGQRFAYGHIGCGDMIIRRAIWNRHLPAYQSGRYAADWDFLSKIARGNYNVCWLDKLLMRCQRVSRGKAE